MTADSVGGSDEGGLCGQSQYAVAGSEQGESLGGQCQNTVTGEGSGHEQVLSGKTTDSLLGLLGN